MKQSSSIVTPVGMNANASILTRSPMVTPRWTSTNEAILQSAPMMQPYRLTCSGWWITTFAPSLTSGAIMRVHSSTIGRELDLERGPAALGLPDAHLAAVRGHHGGHDRE